MVTPPGLHHLGRRRAVGAAQHGLHPRDELGRGERLGEVVVGAELEAEDAVDLAVAGGEEDHRHLRRGADALAHLEAVEVGEADVEHDEPGPVLVERVEAVGRRWPPSRRGSPRGRGTARRGRRCWPRRRRRRSSPSPSGRAHAPLRLHSAQCDPRNVRRTSGECVGPDDFGRASWRSASPCGPGWRGRRRRGRSASGSRTPTRSCRAATSGRTRGRRCRRRSCRATACEGVADVPDALRVVVGADPVLGDVDGEPGHLGRVADRRLGRGGPVLVAHRQHLDAALGAEHARRADPRARVRLHADEVVAPVRVRGTRPRARLRNSSIRCSDPGSAAQSAIETVRPTGKSPGPRAGPRTRAACAATTSVARA